MDTCIYWFGILLLNGEYCQLSGTTCMVENVLAVKAIQIHLDGNDKIHVKVKLGTSVA